MQSETGFPSSHQLKSYVASKSRLKLAARAVLSADAGLLVRTWRRAVDHQAQVTKQCRDISKILLFVCTTWYGATYRYRNDETVRVCWYVQQCNITSVNAGGLISVLACIKDARSNVDDATWTIIITRSRSHAEL